METAEKARGVRRQLLFETGEPEVGRLHALHALVAQAERGAVRTHNFLARVEAALDHAEQAIVHMEDMDEPASPMQSLPAQVPRHRKPPPPPPLQDSRAERGRHRAAPPVPARALRSAHDQRSHASMTPPIGGRLEADRVARQILRDPTASPFLTAQWRVPPKRPMPPSREFDAAAFLPQTLSIRLCDGRAMWVSERVPLYD
jgi:hypothetical protein